MMTTLAEESLVEQNPHWEDKQYGDFFERSHNAAAIRDLDLEEIQVITGIRRCGKSTLLRAIINHLTKITSPKSALYINFDDPNFTPVYNDANKIRNVVTTAEKITSQRVDYLLLDENLFKIFLGLR